MKNIKFLLPILFIISLFIACENDKDEPTLDATITIDSPTAGQVFEKGDTIHIEADITAAQELHGWEIIIRKKSDNSLVYENEEHTHDKELHIHDHWVNNVTEHTDMILEVTAALSHNAKDTKTETVSFHCHPN